MWRFAFLTVTFFFAIFLGMAQSGYYSSDSVKTMGVNVLDMGHKMNSRYCTVKNRDGVVMRLTPMEVKEYRIGYTDIYYSRKVMKMDSITEVFMKCERDGKLKLLSYNDKKPIYYIEGDSILLTELKKDVFREQLLQHTANCNPVSKYLPLVKYNRIAIKQYLTGYNQCRKGWFPHSRLGIYGFFETRQLNNRKQKVTNANFLNFNKENTISFGIAADFPLYYKGLSIHPELQYNTHLTTSSAFIENVTIDFIEESKILTLPLLLRYTLPTQKLRPYAHAGPVIAGYLQNSSKSYQTKPTGNILTIEKQVSDGSNRVYPGISGGIGGEIDISLRLALFFEFRFNALFPSGNSLRYNNTQFITGIIF